MIPSQTNPKKPPGNKNEQCAKRFYRVSPYGILKNNTSAVGLYCELNLPISMLKKPILKPTTSICFPNTD